MYFGGEVHDFRPNPYRGTEKTARFDHLWPGRSDTPQIQEDAKQQYADELKRQIDEKKEREKREKEYLLSGDFGFSTKARTTFPTQLPNEEPTPKPQSLANTYSNINRINDATNDFPTSVPPKSLASTYNPSSGNIPDNTFTQTLKAQIDECRKSSYSSQSQPFQPLNSAPQTMPTFATPTFEISDIDMPNLTIMNKMNRGTSERHIYSVTMSGASSMRSSLEQTRMLPPIIPVESPMNRSKIVTPSMGFSTRPSNFPVVNPNMNSNVATSPYNTSITANYSKTTSNYQKQINPNYNSRPLYSTYGNASFLNRNNNQKYSVSALASTTKPSYEHPVRPTAKKLLSESQMIYADGHRSPL